MRGLPKWANFHESHRSINRQPRLFHGCGTYDIASVDVAVSLVSHLKEDPKTSGLPYGEEATIRIRISSDLVSWIDLIISRLQFRVTSVALAAKHFAAQFYGEVFAVLSA